MIYKEEEITARVHETGSDLYTLNDDGSLDESLDIKIDHEDQTVVWYEVGHMAHLSVKDSSGEELYFVEIPTIEEAKRRIDLYEEQNNFEES